MQTCSGKNKHDPFPISIEKTTKHWTVRLYHCIKTNDRKQHPSQANCPLHPFPHLRRVVSSEAVQTATEKWERRSLEVGTISWDLLYVCDGCNLYVPPRRIDTKSNQTIFSSTLLRLSSPLSEKPGNSNWVNVWVDMCEQVALHTCKSAEESSVPSPQHLSEPFPPPAVMAVKCTLQAWSHDTKWVSYHHRPNKISFMHFNR